MDEWVDVQDEWVDVEETSGKDWEDVSTDTAVATEDWEDVKPKSVKDFILQPISKQITGKSLTERMGLVEKQQKQAEKLGTERALQGKPPSTLEFFMRGLPAQVGEVATGMADLSPLDIGIMLGTAGLAKIPYKGVPIGELASKIPISKRFFKDVGEFTRYQNKLKMMTPLSSRGVTKATTPVSATELAVTPPPEGKVLPDFAENINLTKYPEDVRQTVSELVTKKPSIGKTPTISDKELIARATQLKDTPTIKYLAQLPEGTVEAEALKVRQGNTETIRQALGSELGGLKNQLDNIIEQGIGLHRKTASIFGRGLRQQRLPAETQQNMAFAIEDTLTKIKKDPIFSKDTELIDTVKKLKSLVIEKDFDPTLWNKVYYGWINSILSNPFTHLVNTGSNTLFAVAKIPEKFASAIWDLPLSLKTGKRTQFFGEIPEMIKGAMSRKPLPQELAMGSKLENFSQPLRGVANKIIGFPVKMLQVEDNMAKSLVGRMELFAQKYAGKTGEALTRVVNAEQLYRTFQDDAGVVADTLMTVRSKIPGMRYIVPFIKTPANLIARGIERTPLGAVKVTHGLITKTYTQEVLAKDLGNLTLGTIGAGWIGYQWAKGNITGRVPTDATERDAFYRQGKKPNAIKVGNKWIPLGRLEPFGTSFSIIANLINDYSKSPQDTPDEKIIDAITKLGATLVNKTYLSGFTNMIKALSDPEMHGENFLRNIVVGADPQLLKFFADLKDPYYREANTVLDEFKKKTPFLSETLHPKLNVFGEPVKKDFLNIGTEKDVEFEKMLEETPIGFPSKTMGKEKLEPEEYWWLLEQSGGQIKSVLQQLDYKQFNTLPVEVREKVINQIVNTTREYTRNILRIQRNKQ